MTRQRMLVFGSKNGSHTVSMVLSADSHGMDFPQMRLKKVYHTAEIKGTSELALFVLVYMSVCVWCMSDYM